MCIFPFFFFFCLHLKFFNKLYLPKDLYLSSIFLYHALIFWNLYPIHIDLWKSIHLRLEMNTFHFHKVEDVLPVIRQSAKWFSSPSFYHCCVLCSLLLTDLSFISSSYHPLTTVFPQSILPRPLESYFERAFVYVFTYQLLSDNVLLNNSGPATSGELQIRSLAPKHFV